MGSELSSAKKIGLLLSGGGARGAYQAGAIQALCEITEELEIQKPFNIVTGMSAGSVNAAYWASHAQDPKGAAKRMVTMWSMLEPWMIYQCDFWSMLKNFLSWGSDLAFGFIKKGKRAHSILKTAPLREFLRTYIRFERIERNLKAGHLDALAITALNYSNSTSYTFVQAGSQINHWSRARRVSEEAKIHVDHVMASCAIPLFFPASQINGHYYGDGSLRYSSPLSAAIHLGSEKIIVIGVRKQSTPEEEAQQKARAFIPSLGRIINVIMNSIFLDATELDMERMDRINRTLSLLEKEALEKSTLRPVQSLWLRPSQDLGEIARDECQKLPWTVRYLMGSLGPKAQSSDLQSYLLFIPSYGQKLCDLGYKDTMARKEEIKKFYQS